MGDRAEREQEMGERNGEIEGERRKEKEKRQERKGVERAMEENKERQEMNAEVRDNKVKKGEEDEKSKENNTDRGNQEKEGEVKNEENGVENVKEREGEEKEEESVTETQEEPIIHNLAGEWELDRSENYDEFLKAIGLNVVARRIATQTASVIIEIDQTGDELIIRTLAGPFFPVQKFTVGQTCHIREPDGTKVKLCPRWTSKNLKVECTPIVSGTKQTKSYTVTRQPTLDDRLITKLQAGNVVCTRIFRKVKKR